jgi:TBC1 domain family member 5
MRYPSPSQPHGPRTFLNDAIFIKAHCTVEGGTQLIIKYSNRAPPQFKRIAPRPSTPDSTTGSGTPNSFRARSPFGSPAPRALDALIGEAARGVLSRGEKWGFNLRDAVGEVRKNVQGLQSGHASPRIAPSHRSTRSDISNNIAANVLRKMTVLEDRNLRLAKMLEVAVADLWKIEKKASENQETEDESLQALSIAIAKVQFVQVFLQDSSLPLPPEKPVGEAAVSEEQSKIDEEPVPDNPDETRQPAPKSPPADVPHSPPPQNSPPKPPAIVLASSPIAMTARPLAQTPPSLPTTSVLSEHASGTSISSLAAHPTRPRIEQSSFSWMLGQAHENRKEFINPSPFSPAERRAHAAHGTEEKGFLFGEEDDVVGEPKTK